MKKIFSTSLIVLGIGLFFTSPVFANGLVVEFEDEPLFDEANFLPGESITRWAEVTNNSGQTQRIAVEAINVNNSDRLGDVLVLEIIEGSETRYNKNDLSRFFNEGEVYLSHLANGSSTTYNFSISFYPGTQNPFQGKSLGFDILIGFQGEEGGILPGAGSGGGGLPPGLTIREPVTVIPAETSVTITWVTNYSSTSQVIYAEEGQSHILDLTDDEGTPPKYGYAQTTPEYNVSPKVTSHSVKIEGLESGETYYYRCISHASLAISTEHSFTTLDVIGEQEEEEEEEEEEDEIIVEGETEEGVGEQEEEEEEEEEEEGLLGIPGFVEIQEEVGTGLGWFFAAIGDLFRLENLWWLLLLLIIIIIVLYWLSRKKKRKE